jgi:hypothetical protein
MLHSCGEQPDSPSKTDADISRANYKQANCSCIHCPRRFAPGRRRERKAFPRGISVGVLEREREREREGTRRRMSGIWNPAIRSCRVASLARAWRTFGNGIAFPSLLALFAMWQSSRRLCKMMRRHNHIRQAYPTAETQSTSRLRAAVTGRRSLAASVFFQR